MMPRRFPFLALILSWSMVVLSAAGAPPQIAKVTSPSLQAGAVTTITIEGTDLIPNPQLILSVPIAEQKIKDGATPSKVQVEVRLDGRAPLGVHHLRLASDKGISNAVGIEIDDWPQLPFGPKVESLPGVLQGNLAGSATLSTTVSGKKGQRLVVEIEARRLGSSIDPVLRLFDPRRLLLATGLPRTEQGGDARLETVLPADGPYTIELHDSQFKAGAPGRFRLRLGDFRFADLPFPLAGQSGSKAVFQLVGSVPETTRVEVDLSKLPGNAVIRLPRPPGLGGRVPSILVSDIPEVIETEQPAGKLQEVNIPAGINGRLRAPKEEDSYRLPVQPGMKLRFELLAERWGSPIDGVLTLRNEAGTQLARADDQPGTLDPVLDFTVPAGVTSLIAAVTDAHGRGGANRVYRLAVTPADQPDFDLAILDDRPHVPRNGSALVRIQATRKNFTGPIKLRLTGVPPGVIVAGDEIPAGLNATLLSFTAPENAGIDHGVLHITGEGGDEKGMLRRKALLAETGLSRSHPWLRGELGLAVTDAGPLGIAWVEAGSALPIGGNVPAKLTVRRLPELKGAVRLSLVTTQIVPKTKDKKTDDVSRAIHLDGMPMLKEDESVIEVKIVVPADLPPQPYDVAVRADVLGGDPKKPVVVATAVTASRRMLAAK
jgi:hypothetical protein